jgi:nitrogen fixation protein NifZ
MIPQFEYGEQVRVIRNIRNDGTFPNVPTGTLLIKRGTVGYVTNIGTFLQDQIIYTVHFLDLDRMVGCREEELQLASETWIPSRFEAREKVRSAKILAIQGNIVVNQGDIGEIYKVIRDAGDEVMYQVIFGDKILQVPESALFSIEEHINE